MVRRSFKPIDDTAPGWQTSMVIEAVDLDGRRVPMTVGTFDTGRGTELSVRCGERGGTLLLPMDAGRDLIGSVSEAMQLKQEGRR